MHISLTMLILRLSTVCKRKTNVWMYFARWPDLIPTCMIMYQCIAKLTLLMKYALTLIGVLTKKQGVSSLCTALSLASFGMH
jgi:hypothetical protein